MSKPLGGWPLLLVCSLATSPSWAAPSGSSVTRAATKPALAFESYQLDNGLKVILSRDDRLPRVAVNLWYHVGPVNEPSGRSGFAHLFEHLMFEGSEHVGKHFDRLMESMGANNVNGTTSWDRTNYYETVPSQYLETALWIESDRMAFMTLTPERLEAQRDVVKNERRQSFENTPYGTSDLALLDSLFPEGHPYHGAVIGSMADLTAATMQDVQAFYRTYYAPNNATLTLVGSFDDAKAKGLVQKYFGSLAAREVPERAPHLTPPLDAPLRKTVNEPVELGRVALGWIAAPAYTAEDATLRVVSAMLTTGKAARLYRSLVVEQQLATSVDSWVDANRLCTIFSIEAKARTGIGLDALEAGLWRALSELAADGPTERELGRAKRTLLVDLYGTLERLNGDDGESGRAGLLQRFSYYRKDPGYLQTWLQTLESVRAEDVQRAAEEQLAQTRSVTVLTVPRKTSPSEPTDHAHP